MIIQSLEFLEVLFAWFAWLLKYNNVIKIELNLPKMAIKIKDWPRKLVKLP